MPGASRKAPSQPFLVSSLCLRAGLGFFGTLLSPKKFYTNIKIKADKWHKMSHNYHNLKREEDALMKKTWMLVVIAILLFFAAALFTVGTLDWIDERNNTAPAHIEPGLLLYPCCRGRQPATRDL